MLFGKDFFNKSPLLDFVTERIGSEELFQRKMAKQNATTKTAARRSTIQVEPKELLVRVFLSIGSVIGDAG